MLLASGLIVGESIIGVVISAIVVFSGVAAPLALVGAGYETAGKIIGGIAFAAISIRALPMGPGHGVEAVGVNTRDSLGHAQNSAWQTSIRRNPPNEFPDIVGPHPANPILARFRPFIPPHARLRELTPLPLIIGTLLGMVFGASSLYLVLKVGLTVSASIPVAVISITIFRLLSKFGLRDSTDSRKQHRANRGLGRRINRLRSRRDHARDHDSGVRSRDHARHAGRDSGRTDWNPDDDSAAPRAHRAAARLFEISGRHGLRRSVEGGRVA